MSFRNSSIKTGDINMDEKIISINKLDYRYKKSKKSAIKIDHLDVNDNQLIGLIGANASGKTTLMKIISGYLRDKQGAISVMSGNPQKDDNIRKEIIYSSNDMAIDKSDTPSKLIKYCEFAYPNFDRGFALKLLEIFEIELKKPVIKMSQGQISIVHFTCALAARAKVTLLDEPFNAIDIAKRKTLQEVMLKDFMKNPRTIIISSHHLDELENILSEIILINNGGFVFYEDIDSVREMLFRADGDIAQYKEHNDVVIFSENELGSYLIAKGSTMSSLADEMRAKGIKISSVSPADTCVYLTDNEYRNKVDNLW